MVQQRPSTTGGSGGVEPASATGSRAPARADWFREALKDKGIKPGIAGRKARSKPIKHDTRRNRIEIMFGRLKDGRRIAPRHDRWPKVILSAVALAATVMFWLWRKNGS
jgi:transposase